MERIIIPIWFVTAVLVELFSSMGLCFWLRSRGVRVSPFCYGMPGYMERLYKQWCETHGRSAKGFVIFRAVALVNCVLALIAFILITAGSSGGR